MLNLKKSWKQLTGNFLLARWGDLKPPLMYGPHSLIYLHNDHND